MFEYRHSDSIMRAFTGRWNYPTNTFFADDRELTPVGDQGFDRPSHLRPYEEVCLEVEDLHRRDRDGVFTYPASLRQVYGIYHRLRGEGSFVKFKTWIDHFTDAVPRPSRGHASPSDP